VGDLERRVVSDLNTSYLDAQAMADIESQKWSPEIAL
jgi:hypothetical protein